MKQLLIFPDPANNSIRFAGKVYHGIDGAKTKLCVSFIFKPGGNKTIHFPQNYGGSGLNAEEQTKPFGYLDGRADEYFCRDILWV